MSLKWYLHRLRAMSPGEVVHRLGEKVKKERARGRLEGWGRYGGGAVAPLPGLLDRLRKAPVAVREAVGRAAQSVRDGRFAALGVSWPQRAREELFPATVWRLDPVSQGLWPGAEDYCFDIAYRHERQLGDVKYVWEFNRLQFLQPLAGDVALTGSSESIAAIEAAIGSWHAANPPFRGIGWNSGIELALRAISLLVVMTLAGPQLSAPCRAQIGAILEASLFWLRRYPSRFSSANNHLIAELCAEYLVATAMPDLPGAASVAAEARDKLAEEAGRQIVADGVPAEQSPSYGAFSAEMLLLCVAVGRDLGQPFPDLATERLRAFSGFIEWIALPDGTVPAIGDDDEGRVLTLGEPEPCYPRSVANAIAASRTAADGPDFRGVLLGRGAQLETRAEGCRLFAEGGYFVVNEERQGRRLNLTFDHGPLGYLSIAAHGHADALSVTLAVDGQPVLVDPGTYLYHSGGAWRDWFRGTAAHNTLALPSADQSTISGAFNWSHKARAALQSAETSGDWRVTASHDGYRQRFGLVHERSLARTADGLVISDRLIGGGEVEAGVSFQLAPGLEARVDEQEVMVSRAGAPIVVLGFERGAVRVEQGGAGVGGGWVSPAFGEKVPANRIVWTGRVGPAGREVRVKLV